MKIMKKPLRVKKVKNLNRKISYKNNYSFGKDTSIVIETRFNILIVIITLIIFVLLIGLFYVQVIRNDYYINRVNILQKTIIEGDSTPRGRIYDRNHRLIVNNVPVKTISYKKEKGTTTKQEISLAYKLEELIDVDYSKMTSNNLKNFWIKDNPDLAKQKITKKEWQKLEERKITKDDIEKLKLERVTDDDLKQYTDRDKAAAYIYTLMNKGYSYSEKIIKNKDVSDDEYALVSENLNELNGFDTKLDWKRDYLYGDVFKTILGSVSSKESGIPYELKDYYLAKGYSLDDRVGTSYLEYQYEDLLKGQKAKYEVLTDSSYKLIEEGSRGKDIVLTIDIELQKAIEEILTRQILNTKNEPNTEYYNRSFVIVTNPKTGEILAMAGKQYSNGKIIDYTPGITTSPVAVGSAIKGASHIVGYNNGGLQIGEYRDDACIKIAATPEKCSWQYLGYIDDIRALKYSSNTYQFNTAIKVGKGNYVYDQPLKIDTNAFNIYRKTFAEFGLGIKTGIDLPLESLGYKGNSLLSGHLLDFSIGQYDTYTPIQLSQYISTLANNGVRMQPYLLKQVYSPSKDGLNNLLSETKPITLNKVNTKQEYLDRVKEGFKEVLTAGGTGYGYIDLSYKPAGKTGTSQSFIDTDNNGIIDTETITTTFVAYAPYDNPTVTFTIISPDISHYGNYSNYQSMVNMKIAQEVSKKYFDIYK